MRERSWVRRDGNDAIETADRIPPPIPARGSASASGRSWRSSTGAAGRRSPTCSASCPIRLLIPRFGRCSAISRTRASCATRRTGPRYVYLPTAATRGRARLGAVANVVRTFFDGSVSTAVAALLESKPLSREEYERLSRLLDEASRGGRGMSAAGGLVDLLVRSSLLLAIDLVRGGGGAQGRRLGGDAAHGLAARPRRSAAASLAVGADAAAAAADPSRRRAAAPPVAVAGEAVAAPAGAGRRAAPAALARARRPRRSCSISRSRPACSAGSRSAIICSRACGGGRGRSTTRAGLALLDELAARARHPPAGRAADRRRPGHADDLGDASGRASCCPPTRSAGPTSAAGSCCCTSSPMSPAATASAGSAAAIVCALYWFHPAIWYRGAADAARAGACLRRSRPVAGAKATRLCPQPARRRQRLPAAADRRQPLGRHGAHLRAGAPADRDHPARPARAARAPASSPAPAPARCWPPCWSRPWRRSPPSSPRPRPCRSRRAPVRFRRSRRSPRSIRFRASRPRRRSPRRGRSPLWNRSPPRPPSRRAKPFRPTITIAWSSSTAAISSSIAASSRIYRRQLDVYRQPGRRAAGAGQSRQFGQ